MGRGGPGKATVRRHGSGRHHTLQNGVDQNMVCGGGRGVSIQGHREVPWVWLLPHPAERSRPEHGEGGGGGGGEWVGRRGVDGPGKATVRCHGSGLRHTLQNGIDQNMVSGWVGAGREGEWGGEGGPGKATMRRHGFGHHHTQQNGVDQNMVWGGGGYPFKAVRRHGSGCCHTLQNGVDQNIVSEWVGGGRGGCLWGPGKATVRRYGSGRHHILQNGVDQNMVSGWVGAGVGAGGGLEGG